MKMKGAGHMQRCAMSHLGSAWLLGHRETVQATGNGTILWVPTGQMQNKRFLLL